MPKPKTPLVPFVGDESPAEGADDLDVEILLRSALALCESSEPCVEFNLGLLTPVEKRVLLALLYQRLGFVGDLARRFLGGAGWESIDREIFHAV
ncbi:MAG: hypothetical protein SFU56_06815 [Capsulimonadales bacterium]|nr:hypothetical protein [Capsulimonadales bacterium]